WAAATSRSTSLAGWPWAAWAPLAAGAPAAAADGALPPEAAAGAPDWHATRTSASAPNASRPTDIYAPSPRGVTAGSICACPGVTRRPPPRSLSPRGSERLPTRPHAGELLRKLALGLLGTLGRRPRVDHGQVLVVGANGELRAQ